MVSVRIRDISPRLAFQARPVPTACKIELIERLIDVGVPAIEVTSFVHPDLVPGLADAEEVFRRLPRPAGVSFEACVANATGLRRAIDAGAHTAWFLLSADEDFSLMNTGRSIEQSLALLDDLQAIADGTDTRLGSYVIAAFGGPLGTARTPQDIQPLLDRLTTLGIHDWILADSCGYAAPRQITTMIEHIAPQAGGAQNLTVQIHDSRGMGIACIAELARLGVGTLDCSLAGSGAHPAAPQARVGGVCTEDAVQLLHLTGIRTGIDLPALIDTANWLATQLGATPTGYVRHTGPVPTRDLQAPSALPQSWHPG
ncbi:pyruvate carboxyltransferase [Streptomyces cinereospinus]|uniref:Pyruvate carboxyltransferase n=1 Tax=Streptomyces cinereospinus TaxID=285561 RepID=A0ABV5MXM6_9ACTN